MAGHLADARRYALAAFRRASAQTRVTALKIVLLSILGQNGLAGYLKYRHSLKAILDDRRSSDRRSKVSR
jgi:hypothetical protein